MAGITQPGRTELGPLPLASIVQAPNRTLLSQGAMDLGVPWRVYSLMEATATCTVGLWKSMEGPRTGLTHPRCEAPGGVAYSGPREAHGISGAGDWACVGALLDGLWHGSCRSWPLPCEVWFKSFLETALRCCS